MRLPGGALGRLAREYVGPEPWILGLHEETVYLTFVCSGPAPGHVREASVAAPLLLAAEYIAAVLLDGRRTQRARVASCTWFCQPETADLLAPGHRRQPTALLLLRSQLVDGRHREPALDVQKGSQAPGPPRQLGYREAVGHVVPAGAAVLLGEGAAHEAELPKAGKEPERKLRPVPVVRRVRDDLAVHELADPVPDPLLHVREQSIRVYEVNRP